MSCDRRSLGLMSDHVLLTLKKLHLHHNNNITGACKASNYSDTAFPIS